MSYKTDHDSMSIRRERKVHPIWMVLGWVWFALLIVISGSGARVVSQANRQNNWIALGEGMNRTIVLPTMKFMQSNMDFNLFISWIPGYPFTMDELVFFLTFMMIGVGVFSVVYAFMYSRIIPVRSPLDAPEVEARRGKPRRSSGTRR